MRNMHNVLVEEGVFECQHSMHTVFFFQQHDRNFFFVGGHFFLEGKKQFSRRGSLGVWRKGSKEGQRGHEKKNSPHVRYV